MEPDTTDKLELTGTIIRGVGTGGRYVAIAGFSRQFERILGREPFPGTLNIEVEESDHPCLERLSEMKASSGITINGFSEDGKEYCPAIALHCFVLAGGKQIPSLLVFPEITVHPPEILEIVSPDRILDVAEIGDSVTIHF